MTVVELREILAALPDWHEVEVDPRNGSQPHPIVDVFQQTRQSGPSVVIQ